jgi:hypothetical protein
VVENNERIIELQPPPTLPVEPPTGAWRHLITPPPLPADKRPKILFQETEPQQPWGGPADATWFSGPIDTAEQPKGMTIDSNIE